MQKTTIPKILIVDDKIENLVALEKTLSDMDATFVRALSGNEALTKILEHDFALALIDVQMPEMDGYETVEILRQDENKSGKLPVIFVSAICREESYRIKGIESGAVDFIAKPVVPTILRGKVRVFLELWRYREQLEDVVEKRTHALHESNETLKKEIKQRQQKEAELNVTLKKLEDSNLELEQFAYIASHDLQEPLRKIASFTELLSRRYKGKLDKNADEFIFYIVDSVKRMKTLILDLRRYSKAGVRGGDLEIIDLNEVYRDVCEKIAITIKDANIKVSCDKMPSVSGNKEQLVEVFQNLFSNAIKYNHHDNPEININVSRKDEKWLFEFKDNGIGIENEFLKKIFGIFYRLHSADDYPGTGIGLTLCRKIISRHKGEIWVESAKGQGSTFFFTLPVDLKIQPEETDNSDKIIESAERREAQVAVDPVPVEFN